MATALCCQKRCCQHCGIVDFFYDIRNICVLVLNTLKTLPWLIIILNESISIFWILTRYYNEFLKLQELKYYSVEPIWKKTVFKICSTWEWGPWLSFSAHSGTGYWALQINWFKKTNNFTCEYCQLSNLW